MPTAIDITGQRFGKLVVSRFAGTNRHGARLWACICDCGNAAVKVGGLLRSGHTSSCGCLIHSPFRSWRYAHGETGTPVFKAWCRMIHRCCTTNHRDKDWKNYGGRGITVCSSWRKYENFRDDMGPSFMEGLSLDRIDVNGNYEPANCRWATLKQQARNKRTNRFISFRGETLTSVEWAERFGVARNIIEDRLRLGWSVERAMTDPIKIGRRPKTWPKSFTTTIGIAEIPGTPLANNHVADANYVPSTDGQAKAEMVLSK